MKIKYTLLISILLIILLSTISVISAQNTNDSGWVYIYDSELHPIFVNDDSSPRFGFAPVWTISTDNDNNLFAVIGSHNRIDLDPSEDEFIVDSGSEGALSLCKYDPSGNLQWVNSWLEIGYLHVTETDNDGNIYVAAAFNNEFCFIEGDPITQLGAGSENGGKYLVKFSTDGDFIWSKEWLNPGNIMIHSLNTGPDGQICLAGYFHGDVDLDPGPDTVLASAELARAAYVITLDSNGEYIDSFTANVTPDFSVDDISETSISVKTIQFDSTGNMFIAGTFCGVADFNPDGDVDISATSPTLAGYIIMLTPDGEISLQRTFSETQKIEIHSMEIDDNDVLCLMVKEWLPEIDNVLGPDRFFRLMKIDNEGRTIWEYEFPPVFVSAKMICDVSNNIYFMGINANPRRYGYDIYPGPVDFDPGEDTDMIPVNGPKDLYLTKFSADGDYIRTLIWELENNAQGYRQFHVKTFISDTAGNVYISGIFDGACDFDPGENVEIHRSVGDSNDGFILKVLPDGTW